MMNVVPAKVAGVEEICMATPTPGGKIDPTVLAAASIAGVTEIYRIGGAQAVGALAYGTETVSRVDKIVGPGSRWVAEAKRQVFGWVDIDIIAGPSEIVVIADESADPRHAGIDPGRPYPAGSRIEPAARMGREEPGSEERCRIAADVPPQQMSQDR